MTLDQLLRRLREIEMYGRSTPPDTNHVEAMESLKVKMPGHIRALMYELIDEGIQPQTLTKAQKRGWPRRPGGGPP